MKNQLAKRRLLLAGVAVSCFGLCKAHAADAGLDARIDALLHSAEAEQYSLLTTIPVPGTPLAAFDISAVDPTLPYYYLADRSNAALDIFNKNTNSFVGRVGGFQGVQLTNGVANNSISGPDGVAAVGMGEVWAGDGNSSIKVIDVINQKIVQTISTTIGTDTPQMDLRADEMAYDPVDHVMVAANNAATPPYITFISTEGQRPVLGHLVYSNYAGVEASVYDRATGMFYINLTQTLTDVNSGAVSVVDPRQLKEVKQYPIANCNGAGIAVAPGHKLLVGCSLTNNSQILDTLNGNVLATIPQVSGSDEVVYNPGDAKFYLAARNNPPAAGGPSLGVIDAVTNKFVTNIGTDISAHSVAADKLNNHIFVPIGVSTAATAPCATGCIAVYVGKEKETPVEAEIEKFVGDLAKQ